MDCLLGIDLGTSSVRAAVIDFDGRVLALAQEEYNFLIPRQGWAEMDSEVWWNATIMTIRKVLGEVNSNTKIKAVGFSGQMHGLVALDKDGHCVRNPIIWCDQRSISQLERVNCEFGSQRLGKIIHSPMAAGFQAVSLLWVKENEPEIYAKIRFCILPKDYIRYRLTGEIATDITDAASTGYFDCNDGKWSEEFLDFLGIDADLLPKIGFPYEIAGEVTSSAARETGLAKGTLVSYGGADQVMQLIGNGIIKSGIASVSIGTAGQILMPLDSAVYDSKLRTHSFCFALPGKWYYMGAALSSGLALKWGRNLFDSLESFREIDGKCKTIKPGSEGLLFLPYLIGERTPLMDPYARGTFFGLTLNHNKYHLFRSIMEGVAYSMRDCMKVLTEDLGQRCDTLIVSGGGSQSKIWTQILADVLGREIYRSNMKEQAVFGAAISAGIAAGEYANYDEATKCLVSWNKQPTIPIPKNRKIYDQGYVLFRCLYNRTKDLMFACGGMSQDHK